MSIKRFYLLVALWGISFLTLVGVLLAVGFLGHPDLSMLGVLALGVAHGVRSAIEVDLRR